MQGCVIVKRRDRHRSAFQNMPYARVRYRQGMFMQGDGVYVVLLYVLFVVLLSFLIYCFTIVFNLWCGFI